MIKAHKKKRIRQRTIWPYIQSIPEIIVYEIVSKLILLALVFILKKILMALVLMTGRVAVTSGDFGFMFKSPWGWLAIIITLVMFGVYVAFDINILLNYCGEKALGRPARLMKLIPESIIESKLFFTPGGLVVLLYSVLITPTVGIGLSISLTKNLYVPNFVSSVIRSNIFYNSMYTVFQILMIVLGVLGMFTIPGMVIDHITAAKSFRKSVGIVVHNFKDLVKNILMFVLKYALISILIMLALAILPAIFIMAGSAANSGLERFGAISFALAAFGWVLASSTLFLPLFILKLTQLYYKYTMGTESALKSEPTSYIRKFIIAGVSCYLFLWSFTGFVDIFFDDFFPSTVSSLVIGHRGAGNEGSENTVGGIRKAIELNCFGAEIDIQRTADGYYVLNHDKTFGRVTGVDKAPGDLTLEEIRKLEIKDAPGERIPTIDEVLDVTLDNIVLFIELKGASADIQMCEDIVAKIKERGLLDFCVIISLKYDLIDYIETKYPEVQTGYLAFISLGKTAELNCDYLGLEEQAATSEVIDAAHANGRRIMVWTPNSAGSQRRFLLSDADALITDNMSQAYSLMDELSARDYLSIMADKLLNEIS